MVNEIIAILLGYLLGSIPSAYIVTRIVTGKDIRRLGGGNVGGTNVFREVGMLPALIAGLADLGKGAAAVAIAYWLLDLAPLFVMLAGLAAVIGHNWMLFLRFSGGKGMGPTFGALVVLLPVYGYWQALAIFAVIALIPFIITRNIALSMGTGLVALPVIVWLVTHSAQAIILTVVLGILIAIKFLPTARAAWAKSEDKRGFVFDRWQREKKE